MTGAGRLISGPNQTRAGAHEKASIPRWYRVGSELWRCKDDFSPTAPTPPTQSSPTTSSSFQSCAVSSEIAPARAVLDDAEIVWCLRTPVVFVGEPGTAGSWLGWDMVDQENQ
jgi:hypothetical protein